MFLSHPAEPADDGERLPSVMLKHQTDRNLGGINATLEAGGYRNFNLHGGVSCATTVLADRSPGPTGAAAVHLKSTWP